MSKILQNKYLVLFYFCTLALIANLDRFILIPLIGPIKTDLGLSDQEVARAMMVFTYSFALCAPLFGFLGDKFRRKPLIIGSLLLWSIASLGSGFSNVLITLLMWRALVGAGEGVYSSLSPSWLDDTFRDKGKNFAFTMLAIIAPMGYSLALILGGYISSLYDWRVAFFISGIPGLVLVGLLFFLKEPNRDLSVKKNRDQVNLKDVLVLIKNPLFLLIILMDFLLEIGRGTASFWGASYLQRVYEISNISSSQFWGIVYLVFGSCGPLLALFFVSKIAKKYGNKSYLIWTLICTLFAIATTALALITDQLGTAKFWFALSVMFVTASFALHVPFLFSIVPDKLKGTAVAVKVCLLTIFANMVITELVGYLSDQYTLAHAMWISPIALALSFLVTLSIMLFYFKKNIVV
ncbi:MAG: MFS transporter [Acinetobacter amyesii]|uniref:MFS transporter n=1 Tax=Acinetobacter amyesii TaxID=2942470 RepID=UPI003D062009